MRLTHKLKTVLNVQKKSDSGSWHIVDIVKYFYTIRCQIILTPIGYGKFCHLSVLTLFSYRKFRRFQILAASGSETFSFQAILTLSSFRRFWHYPVLKFSITNTFRHWGFWHFPVLKILAPSGFIKLWHWCSDTFRIGEILEREKIILTLSEL